MASKLDSMSQSFKFDEGKLQETLDARSQEMKSLETENAEMKKQLAEQEQQIKKMQQDMKAEEAEVNKVKAEEQKFKAAPAPVVQATPAAVVQATPAPVVQATPAPVVQATAAPVVQATPAPVVQKQEVKQQQLRGSQTDSKQAAVSTQATQTVAYATKPWDATFSVHLDGKADGKAETFTIRVHPEWAPEGAKRFQDILQAGILKDARFFRVVPDFMVQWGIPGEPKVAAEWVKKRIPDDPVKMSNSPGMVSFATSGPNSRTTQMFINYVNNDFLDKQGFSPFAEVLAKDMGVVHRIQSKYREKPNQGKIQHHGNAYLAKHFPELSFIDHVDYSFASVEVPKPAAALPSSSQKVEP